MRLFFPTSQSLDSGSVEEVGACYLEGRKDISLRRVGLSATCLLTTATIKHFDNSWKVLSWLQTEVSKLGSKF